MIGSTTRVPDLVAALLAATNAALPDTVTVDGVEWPITVVDGPTLSDAAAPNVIVIGAGNDESASPYSSDRSPAGFDGSIVENGVVRCELTTITAAVADADGDPSIWAAPRDRAHDWLNIIDAMLRTDPRVTETVDYAYVSSVRWFHLKTVHGSLLGAAFDVRYQAHL